MAWVSLGDFQYIYADDCNDVEVLWHANDSKNSWNLRSCWWLFMNLFCMNLINIWTEEKNSWIYFCPTPLLPDFITFWLWNFLFQLPVYFKTPHYRTIYIRFNWFSNPVKCCDWLCNKILWYKKLLYRMCAV